VLVTGAYLLLPRPVDNVDYAAFGLSCVAAIAVRVRGIRPAQSALWALFAGGLLLLVAGDGVLASHELASHEHPFPSVADGAYLAGYVLLACGLAVLIRAPARGNDRAAMIDAFIVAIGLGVLVWCFRMVRYAIGIAVNGGDQKAAEELLRDADIAMYAAKQEGKAPFAIFKRGMHTDVLERLELESALRRAVERQEFFLQYQPIVNLASGSTIAVEALLRWQHPDRGVVPPLSFIDSAEQTGLIVPIGRWALREACRQTQAWHDAHTTGHPLTLNVNLSVRQLHDPGLLTDVAAALHDSGFPPDNLTLEITETVLMGDSEGTIARLHELTALGVRLAIDDFGTGYSALSYLSRLPISTLKLPKPFIDDLGSDPEVLTVVKGIVELGRSLRLEVIAEGIETADQADELLRMQCDMGQGFRFARPMDSDAVEQLLGMGTRDAMPSTPETPVTRRRRPVPAKRGPHGHLPEARVG
jgi:EAL domain-containing protein (putative c-di-GMP-specific phosphodiesterase class I)